MTPSSDTSASTITCLTFSLRSCSSHVSLRLPARCSGPHALDAGHLREAFLDDQKHGSGQLRAFLICHRLPDHGRIRPLAVPGRCWSRGISVNGRAQRHDVLGLCLYRARTTGLPAKGPSSPSVRKSVMSEPTIFEHLGGADALL